MRQLCRHLHLQNNWDQNSVLTGTFFGQLFLTKDQHSFGPRLINKNQNNQRVLISLNFLFNFCLIQLKKPVLKKLIMVDL